MVPAERGRAPQRQPTGLATSDVALTVGEPGELAGRYYPNGQHGGLTLDGKSPGKLGLRVRLTIRVERPPRTFVLTGRLAWARHASSGGQTAAFGVDFLPEDDGTRVRLLSFARGELDERATRHEGRLQVELPVQLVHDGLTRKESLADLSPGGAFVRTWNPLQPGERVELSVRPPRSLRSLTLTGRVVWARSSGHDAGMGIAFDDGGARARLRIERLLAKLPRG
jgi:uncharacterized protein (TIGR02266 family)